MEAIQISEEPETQEEDNRTRMSTICKKEIRAYLTSMSGYVIAFMLLVTGIYFTAYHMNMGYPIYTFRGKLYFPDRNADPDYESIWQKNSVRKQISCF